MTITDLERLARAAITHEPSDHSKLSSVKMQIWQDALDDFHDEAHPERVLQLLDVIEAAKAMRKGKDCPMCDNGKLRNPDKEHWDTCGFATFDAKLAALEEK